MIQHIVLVSFKPSVSEPEALGLLAEMKKLQDTIPQIRSCTYGKNNSPEGLSQGFEYCFVMTFNNAEDRAIYLEHPAHVAVAQEKVMPALENGVKSAIIFDYDLSQ